MIWFAAIVSAVIGAAFWGIPGFLALGFLGWLVGFIIKASRQNVDATSDSVSSSSMSAHPATTRIDLLENRIRSIEARLARIEKAGAPGMVPEVREPEPVSEVVPVVESIAEAATVSMAAQPAKPGTDPGFASPAAAPPKPGSVPGFEPEEPNFIVAWFMGGNTIVRVGLVILFVGLAFLVKYSVDHNMIPVELRVAAVAAAGLALLVVGWRLRERRAGYALSMQGAGVAVLYLTVFGALKLYHLLPAGMAFAFLVVIAVASAVLAIAQDSLALAVFGAAGGFLAPVLASTGGGSHIVLFSYYLVLNAGIVAVAYFRAWRVLNIVGFAFTFLIGLAWGERSYQASLFESTEFFLGAFFLMYVAIAILFARRQVAAYKSYVDGTIVFGVPIAAFGLQAGLMRGSEFGLAFSSLAAGALYIFLASVLRRIGERWTMLCEAFLALGVVFITLAIPLALDARWTSAAWSLEGAAIVWIGVRQRRKLATAFGAFLQLAAGGAFFRAYPAMPEGPPLADAIFVGAVLIAVAGILTYRVLRPALIASKNGFEPVASLFFVWGVLWWVGAGAHEVRAFLDEPYHLNAMVALLAATVLIFTLVSEREHWEAARWPSWIFAAVLFCFALAGLIDGRPPLDFMGWVAWPFAFIVHFAVLRRQQGAIPLAVWEQCLHALGIIALAMIGAQELEWLADQYTASGTAWSLASRIVVPAALILWISRRGADESWPVGVNLVAYRRDTVTVLVIALFVWSLHINFSHAGGSDPLPYIPFLNAIDLGHIFAAIAILSAWRALRRSELAPPPFLDGKAGITIVSAVVFFWLNAVLLRTLHHWVGIPYDFHSLWSSVIVQASLSIFWSVLALTLMLVATRIGRRGLWIVGASLMAVVVVKLVLVDLSRLAGIERIVSFIGVGVLMLVIGYFSPVPPKRAEVTA